MTHLWNNTLIYFIILASLTYPAILEMKYPYLHVDLIVSWQARMKFFTHTILVLELRPNMIVLLLSMTSWFTFCPVRFCAQCCEGARSEMVWRFCWRYRKALITLTLPPPGTCPMLLKESTFDFTFFAKVFFLLSTLSKRPVKEQYMRC